jgi:hypothetical protein
MRKFKNFILGLVDRFEFFILVITIIISMVLLASCQGPERRLAMRIQGDIGESDIKMIWAADDGLEREIHPLQANKFYIQYHGIRKNERLVICLYKDQSTPEDLLISVNSDQKLVLRDSIPADTLFYCLTCKME